MKKIIKGLTFSTILLFSVEAQAGSTCMGETYSGKIVKVTLNTMGAYGAFSSAEVKVTEASGSVLIDNKSEYSAQFAETMRGEQALVVYSNIGSDYDIFLNYLGTDYSTVLWVEGVGAELVDILKDPKRKKEEGNSLVIHSYMEGISNIELTDIVCSLDHDA